MKKRFAGGTAIALIAGSAVFASPASAGYADCLTYIRGSNNDGVGIACSQVVGLARARGDCPLLPDVYTPWVGSWGTGVSRFCIGSHVRTAILEVRS